MPPAEGAVRPPPEAALNKNDCCQMCALRSFLKFWRKHAGGGVFRDDVKWRRMIRDGSMVEPQNTSRHVDLRGGRDADSGAEEVKRRRRRRRRGGKERRDEARARRLSRAMAERRRAREDSGYPSARDLLLWTRAVR